MLESMVARDWCLILRGRGLETLLLLSLYLRAQLMGAHKTPEPIPSRKLAFSSQNRPAPDQTVYTETEQPYAYPHTDRSSRLCDVNGHLLEQRRRVGSGEDQTAAPRV